MTSSPPRLASWTMARLLPTADRELVLGDLWEEFHQHVAPTRGVRSARRWYWRQVIGSAYPLTSRSWHATSGWNATMAAIVVLLSLAPPCLLVMARSFALSQVPLKTTAEPSALFLVVLLLCAAASLAAGARCALGVLHARGDACEGNKIELWEPPTASQP